MRRKRYFSSESAHGSESSHGFANDTIVLAFYSKIMRDWYVSLSSNISCRAIKASQATAEATNVSLTDNHNGRPAPFSKQCWVIATNNEFFDYPVGCIGHLEIGESYMLAPGLTPDGWRFYR